MSRRPSPANSHTSNDQYGNFSHYDNPNYRRTFTNRLPNAEKNKNQQHQLRRHKTASEEYGSFWSSMGTGRKAAATPISSGRQQNFHPSPRTAEAHSRPIPPDPGVEERHSYSPPQQRSQRHQGAATPSIPRRPHSNSLPPITGPDPGMLRTQRLDTRSQKRPRFRDSRAPSVAGGHNVRVSGVLPSNVNFPEIKRIDLDLHTADGTVITVTAVPVHISYKKRN